MSKHAVFNAYRVSKFFWINRTMLSYVITRSEFNTSLKWINLKNWSKKVRTCFIRPIQLILYLQEVPIQWSCGICGY